MLLSNRHAAYQSVDTPAARLPQGIPHQDLLRHVAASGLHEHQLDNCCTESSANSPLHACQDEINARLATTGALRRYDPYGRVLTREEYDQEGMRSVRRRFVQQASRAQQWGVVLGTLGRQGNPRILTHLQSLLASRGLPYTTVRPCPCSSLLALNHHHYMCAGTELLFGS